MKAAQESADLVSENSSSDYRVPITVAAHNLSYTVRQYPWQQTLLCSATSKAVSPTGNDVGHRRLELLSKVTFIAKPGELIALLGPSGCGKTTLLNVIAGRARGQKSGGEILFNGLPIPSSELKGLITMLHANDKHLPFLTVRETLMFTAFLKMAHVSAQERRDAVDRVLRELSLYHVRDTHIGGSWKKGLSTGELRRTSIAQELIGNPAILILDEPTSGLDAVLAYEVVFVLRRLAAAGRTIICSLHQPRSSILQLLDKVVLMANGQILYQGEPKAARAYFETHVGRQINPEENIAEAMLAIASNVVDPHDVRGRRRSMFVMSRDGSLSREAASKYETSDELRLVVREIEKATEISSAVTPSQQRNAIVQWVAEVWAIAFRSFTNTIRNWRTVLSLILIQTFIGALLGFMFYKLPKAYMPDVTPPDIGSPASAPMTMLNSTIATFLTTGIDKQGTNPLISMITEGVDGNGSVPLTTFLESSAPVYLSNMLPCTHHRLGLDTRPEYASANFTPYYDRWDGAKDKSIFEGGPWAPPQIAASILMTLQLADHTLMKSNWFDYWHYCRQGRPAYLSMLACYGCVSGAFEFLGAAAECTGLPPMPTRSTDCRRGVSEDPDSLPWPDGWPRSVERKAVEVKRVLAEELADLDGVGDAASTRKLQTSAMLAGGFDSLAYLLPPQVIRLGAVVSEYLDAMRVCRHPACQLTVEKMEGSESSGSNSLSDYGKVLGTTLQIAGAMFFVACEVGFASYDGLLAISGERDMVNREMANHLYKPSSYFIGKNIAEFPFQVIPTLCLTTAYYFLVGFETGPNDEYFRVYLGVCLCLMFAGYGLSYLLSALSPTMETAVVMAPLIMVLLVCVAGFFVRDSALPLVVVPLKWISIYRWAFFALTMSQFPRGRSYGGIPNTFTLALVGVPETTVTICCLSLIALGVGFRFFAYLSLKLLYRRAGVE